MNGPRKPSPTPEYDGGQRVYSGRVELRAVYSDGAGFFAVDASDEELGRYRTRAEAVGAVLEAASRKTKGGAS